MQEESENPLKPELPFEFLVRGIPVSLQGSNPGITRWKSNVEEAARAALPEGSWLLDERLSVTIFFFPLGKLTGDIDNRLKPILDALVQCVYLDDSQIERLVAQKFETDGEYNFGSPSPVLTDALTAGEPAVYIRITDDLFGELP